MAIESSESMISYLVLEVFEAAVNLALSHEPEALALVRANSGRIVRVKTTAPDWMFFVELCADGVQLYAEYDETVDARITLPTMLLAQYVIGTGETNLDLAEGVRVSGDLELLTQLLGVLYDFSLWSLVKQILDGWLPEFSGLGGLIEALKNHDPAWIVRLEHLPQLANETLVAVRTQSELLQRQSEEIREIRQQLEADRRASWISTVVGLCLIVMAFLAHNGHLQVPQLEGWSLDTLVLLILSLALLVPRLLGRR